MMTESSSVLLSSTSYTMRTELYDLNTYQRFRFFNVDQIPAEFVTTNLQPTAVRRLYTDKDYKGL